MLKVNDLASVRRFKREIRASFAGFLRFTHRYWFHEVAEQAQARALFHMCAGHLGLDPLYAEVKERIADMNSYLEADSQADKEFQTPFSGRLPGRARHLTRPVRALWGRQRPVERRRPRSQGPIGGVVCGSTLTIRP